MNYWPWTRLTARTSYCPCVSTPVAHCGLDATAWNMHFRKCGVVWYPRRHQLRMNFRQCSCTPIQTLGTSIWTANMCSSLDTGKIRFRHRKMCSSLDTGQVRFRHWHSVPVWKLGTFGWTPILCIMHQIRDWFLWTHSILMCACCLHIHLSVRCLISFTSISLFHIDSVTPGM